MRAAIAWLQLLVALRRRFAAALLFVLVLLAFGCKHDLDALYKDTVDTKLRDGGTGSGTGGNASHPSGSGGRGGSSGGSGGASDIQHPATACGTCPALPGDTKDGGVRSCCRGLGNSECGLTFGDGTLCLQRMVAGQDNADCPGSRLGVMKLDGCCRADSRCGFEATGLDLGCVAREDVPVDLAGAAAKPIGCTYECQEDGDCNTIADDLVCTDDPKDGSHRICAKQCQRDQGCLMMKGKVCALGNDVSMNRVLETCQDPVGPAKPGEFCSSARDCGSGVCFNAQQQCSQLCLNDADCTSKKCIQSGIDRPDGGMPQKFGTCAL